ncbi:MAG: bifunctional phosphoglucose/phosphomannose isomerase [Candidatus Helarchaeota archaeon]
MTDKTILDDEKKIKQIDSANMYKFLIAMPDSCVYMLEKSKEIQLNYNKQFNNILICGMGGSAIGGNLVQNWLFDKLRIPVLINRRYNLPAFVDENTLMIVISYSGNTEETLSAFQQGVEKKSTIIGISSNGKLIEYCEKLGLAYIKVPSGIQPRAAISYLFISILICLQKAGLIPDFSDAINAAIKILENLRIELSINSPASKNIAKRIAMNIQGHLPLIYAPPGYGSLARRLKCQINENSKNLALWDEFSELNHNEIVGLQNKSIITENCCVLLLRTQDEEETIKNRIEITKDVIFKDSISAIYEIWATGKSKLEKMFSLLYIGDFISYYLAILKGVNPTPVESISKLKNKLKEKLNTSDLIEKKLFSA